MEGQLVSIASNLRWAENDSVWRQKRFFLGSCVLAQYCKAVISFLRLPLRPEAKNSSSLRGIGAEDDAVQPIACSLLVYSVSIQTTICV